MENMSSMTLEEAKQAYPDWYERRVERGEPRRTWKTNRALYDWWLRRIRFEITVGHRYFGIMTLAIYAKKCGIEEEELRRDAYSLLEHYDVITVEENNHFTKEDIEAALKAYDNKYITFPRDDIAKLAGIPIKKNKRNGRTQAEHLMRARAVENIDYPNGEWRNKNGAPTKREAVREWRMQHPDGRKVDCQRETGLAKATVRKWWDTVDMEEVSIEQEYQKIMNERLEEYLQEMGFSEKEAEMYRAWGPEQVLQREGDELRVILYAQHGRKYTDETWIKPVRERYEKLYEETVQSMKDV